MTFGHEQSLSSAVWTVVADGGRARVLTRDPGRDAALALIDELECPEGLAHMRDLVTDRQGYFKGRTGSIDSGDSHSRFKRHTALGFARLIVDRLEAGRQAGEYGALEIVAAPRILGALRSEMPDPLKRLVTRSLARDYTALTVEELAERLNSSQEHGESEPVAEFEVVSHPELWVITPGSNSSPFACTQFEAEGECVLRDFESAFDTRHAVVDFRNTDYFGSGGIGFLTRLWSQVRARNGSLILCNLSELETDVLRVTRLNRLWPQTGSLEEAIAAIGMDASPSAS